MTGDKFPAEPTASRLKRELRDSLLLLMKDFEGLKHFAAEITPEGISASIPLSKDDLHDLLAATMHDAANDIVFEAIKIKEKLERLSLSAA